VKREASVEMWKRRCWFLVSSFMLAGNRFHN
jgi:hypothetical protein